MAFYLAGEITQVKESIPWVRCASGNVFLKLYLGIKGQKIKLVVVMHVVVAEVVDKKVNKVVEEDLVDGFVFQSFSEAWDFSSMQPLCNFEVLSLLD